MVLIISTCGEGSDEPACTHVLVRAFASCIIKVCKLKKTPNNFNTSIVSLDTPEWAIIRGFFGYAIRPNLTFVCPFLMIKILNPCPAEFQLVIYYYCIRLENQTSLVMVERLFLTVPRGCLQFVIVVFPDHTHLLFLPYRHNLKKVQPYPPPKFSQHIHSRKWNAAGPQQHSKDKHLPGMLTYKVGHPCRLRFSWLHE